MRPLGGGRLIRGRVPPYSDMHLHVPLPPAAVSGMMGAARAHVVDVRSGDMPMRLLIAILIPFFLFFTNGRPVAGIGP